MRASVSIRYAYGTRKIFPAISVKDAGVSEIDLQ